jgi:Tol biopolymer transport system component
MERLLTSSDADRALEPIALLTGEWYRTTVVAPDGQNPRWSPDGRFAAFTTSGGRVTTVVEVAGDSVRPVATINGVSLVFSPAGDRVAYLAIDETAELRTARSVADSLLRAQEFGRFQRQRQDVVRLEQELARIMVRDLRSGATEELPAPSLTKRSLAFGADGSALYVVGGPPADRGNSDIYAVSASGAPRAVSSGAGLKSNPMFAARGRYLAYTVGTDSVAIREIATGTTRTFAATSPALSADGSTLVFLSRAGGEYTIHALTLAPASHRSSNAVPDPWRRRCRRRTGGGSLTS